jgi:hypothetical protein
VIHWSWDVGTNDVPDQLAGYRLVVAESEDELESLGGSARVFDGSHNPELAHYQLQRAAGMRKVVKTMTDEHTPGTVYFARLIAEDTSGRESSTDVAQKKTQDPSLVTPIEIFTDAPVPELLPDNGLWLHTPACGNGGGACYEFRQTSDCDECYENLRLRGLDFMLDVINSGPLSTSAYVEYSVEVEAAAPSYWSETRLRLGNDGGEPHELREITYRTTSQQPGYRTYQLPMRMYDKDGVLMMHSDLAGRLVEWGIGGDWVRGAIVRVDDVRIMW